MLSVHSSPAGRLGSKDQGGMSVYIRQLAAELGKRGYSLDIFTRQTSTGQPSIIPLSPGVRVISLPAGPAGPLGKLELPPHLPQWAREVEAFRREQGLRYRIIYSHYWLSGWAGESLKREWGIPHLVTFHTVGASKQAAPTGPAEPQLRLQTEEQLVHSAHRLLVATEAEKHQLVEHYDAPAGSIRIVPCGVDLALFKPGNRARARERTGFAPEEKLIVYVGRIDPIKGIERLVEAVVQLPGHQRVKLIIAGGDESNRGDIQRLQERARARQAEERIEFWGLVDHEQLPQLYNAADICAVVSYYESFGLVALEALACGTPVIASDVGILGKLITGPELGTVLSTDHSPSALARALRERFSKPQPDPEVVRRGVAGYGWGHAACRFQQVLAEFSVDSPTRF